MMIHHRMLSARTQCCHDTVLTVTLDCPRQMYVCYDILTVPSHKGSPRMSIQHQMLPAQTHPCFHLMFTTMLNHRNPMYVPYDILMFIITKHSSSLVISRIVSMFPIHLASLIRCSQNKLPLQQYLAIITLDSNVHHSPQVPLFPLHHRPLSHPNDYQYPPP